MKRVALYFVLAMIVLPAGNVSDVSAQETKAAELCTPDVMRLCQEFIPDVDRITDCMQKSRRKLSPECLAVFKPPTRRRHAPIKQE